MAAVQNGKTWYAAQFIDGGELVKKGGVRVLFEGFNTAIATEENFDPRFTDSVPERVWLDVPALFAVADGRPADPAHGGVPRELAFNAIKELGERAKQYGPGGSHYHKDSDFVPAMRAGAFEMMLQALVCGNKPLTLAFNQTEPDTYATSFVGDAAFNRFAGVLTAHGIDVNAHTRPRVPPGGDMAHHYAQAVHRDSKGAIVCDSSVIEQLEQKGLLAAPAGPKVTLAL